MKKTIKEKLFIRISDEGKDAYVFLGIEKDKEVTGTSVLIINQELCDKFIPRGIGERYSWNISDFRKPKKWEIVKYKLLIGKV